MSSKTRRQFLEDSMLAAAAALPVVATSARAQNTAKVGPNDRLRVGVIGVRGRGRAHVGAFKRSEHTEVVAICDPDSAVIGGAQQAVPSAKYYKDIQELLADDSIDAVSIATPNHWHSLAAIWGLQAGKHVYVEKPLSHNVQEGRRLVEAAAKYGKSGLLVQHGTQGRSMKATMDAMAWLQSGGLGKVRVARGLCYKGRQSIGKVDGPQTPPASLDYDLWTGPAEMQPLMRKNLHYDWHWVFNTGNGDIGNQGAHQMDIARWGLGRDGLPEHVVSCGGRHGYEDDGDTPNTQVALYDYGDQQIVFEVRGLKTGGYKGAKIGVVFHCEGGYLVCASYTKILAFDHDGKVVKTFTGGGDHFGNFIDAVKSGRPEDLHANALEGHLSAALCHIGNISYRLGEHRPLTETEQPFGVSEAGNEAFLRTFFHLASNSVDTRTPYSIGPRLQLDPSSERFAGEHADRANELLGRSGRGRFVIPAAV